MARGYRGRGGKRERGGGGGSGGGRGPRLRPGQVAVNGYSSEWLDRGFCWVYRDEVVAGADGAAAGDTIEVIGNDGRSRGSGVWSDEGRIALRRFRVEPGPVDADLLAERLRAARARRVLPPDTTAWRWVHGENDDLPGVRIDVWGPEVAISLDSPGLQVLVPGLVAAIADQLQPLDAVWQVARPAADSDDDAVAAEALLWGHGSEEPVEVQERGLRYGVLPGRGHDVGLYCDMRDVRAWLAPFLPGRRVLNLFAHTGAFSVHAAAHGAAEVVTADLSQGYLDRARDNLLRNGLDLDGHELLAEDSFAVLDRLRRKGQEFDLVIADPPSFSHGPRGDWSVSRDLARLVAACCRVMAPGGWLLVASNHGGLSPKDFGRMVQQGSLKAGRPLRLLHEGSTPIDFPAALSFPEARYLKCWVLEG